MRTRAKFLVFPETKDGEKIWRWNLYAGNNQVILSSAQTYQTRKTAVLATIGVRFTRLKKVHVDMFEQNEEWFFILKDKSLRPLGLSEGYTSKSGAMNGIKSVIRHSSFAKLRMTNHE